MTERPRRNTDSKRMHERFDLRLGAELRFKEFTTDATTRDLSVGGVGVECGRELPEDADLVLLLFLVLEGVEDEKTPPLAVKARVMWTAAGEAPGEPCRSGLRFEAITPAQQDWLRRFLKVSGTE
jgi:hypothetical protein